MNPNCSSASSSSSLSREMNSVRPPPLRIHKDSHFIHKSSTVNDRKNPVIIYTRSPKIIHTHARDFMALVQKLTGFSSNSGDSAAAPPPPPASKQEKASEVARDAVVVRAPPSPAASNDAFVNWDATSATAGCGCFLDVPLFTPTAAAALELFLSPKPLFGLLESPVFGGGGGAVSPVGAFLKAENF